MSILCSHNARRTWEWWEDICFSLDPAARDAVTERVMEEYRKVAEEG